MSKFGKLVGKLKRKGYSAAYAKGVAAKAGRAKYGEKEMEKKAEEGRKRRSDE